MAGFELNTEKAPVVPAGQKTFSPAQAEGFSTINLMKVADESLQRGILPVMIICPDGTVAGTAGTKQQAAKLNAECRDKG